MKSGKRKQPTSSSSVVVGDADGNSSIPFIVPTPENQAIYMVHPKAKEFLLRPQWLVPRLGCIIVAGNSRSGKSSIMNFLQESDAFQVSSTTVACTKGLILHSKPFMIQPMDGGDPFPSLVVDTEGINGLDATNQHNTNIFVLALLLGSLLVYNQKDSIDEAAINSFGIVCELGRIIQASTDNKEDIGSFTPNLLWLLRDFALEPKDASGRDLTANQYLEYALQTDETEEVTGSASGKQDKYRVRRIIKQTFPRRTCFTMVRPTEDEKSLQSISSSASLRPIFTKQLKQFRQLIKTTCPYKTAFNKPINGPVLLRLAQLYVDAINANKAPVIRDTVAELHATGVFDTASTMWRTKVEQTVAELEQQYPVSWLPPERLTAALTQCTTDSLAYFKSSVFHPSPEHETKLEQLLNERTKQYQTDNHQKLNAYFSEVIFPQIEALLHNPQVKRFSDVSDAIQSAKEELDKNIVPADREGWDRYWEHILYPKVASWTLIWTERCQQDLLRLEPALDQVKQLTEQVDTLTRIRADYHQLQTQYNQLQSQHQELTVKYQRDKKESERVIDETTRQLSEQAARLTVLQNSSTQLTALQKQYNELQSRYEEYDTRLKESTDECESLKRDIQSMQTMQEQQIAALQKEGQAMINHWRQVAEEKEEETCIKQKQVEQHLTIIQSLKQKNESLEQNNRTLSEQVRQSLSTITTVETGRKEVQARLETVQQELRIESQRKQEAERQLAEKQTQWTTASAAHEQAAKEWQQQLEQEQAHASQAITRYREMDKKCNETEFQLVQCKQEVETIRLESESRKQKHEEMKAKYNELMSRFRELESKLRQDTAQKTIGKFFV